MGALECPTCGSQDVVNINLTVEDGERVSFYSCHRCERRWWYKDGEQIELPDVLQLAKRKPPAARS